jgi:hypothetical protein
VREKRTGLSPASGYLVLWERSIKSGSTAVGAFGSDVVGVACQAQHELEIAYEQTCSDTYTVDATSKPEECVEALDDEDDDE